MSDGAAVAMAIAAWCGAVAAWPAPRWPSIVAVAVALLVRSPRALVAATFVLACGLGAAAWSGIEPAPPRTVRAQAVLLSDPRDVRGALQVDLGIDGRRVEGWARSDAAAALRTVLAGEVVTVEGRVRPLADDDVTRAAIRHVVARMDVATASLAGGGSTASRAANAIRRVLDRGTAPLSTDRRALLTGVLIGDDRELPPTVESDFRAAGLTHLLAVSGQNVAFVLAVCGPVLRRLQLRGRLVASLAVIGFFAVLTRAEPSVLRASAMAAIGCWAAFAGRPVSRVRVLSLAVTALVLVDPMLPRSLGFQLSVGASLGLCLLAAPVAARLPGPRWLTEAMGVTVAAQLGVVPVLTVAFGGVPLVGVLANLLAVPIAGPLTAWGITAGLVAGVAGAPVDALLHLPSVVMLDWLLGVARRAAQVPLGLVTAPELLVVGGVGLVASHARGARLGAVAMVVTLLVVARPSSAAIAGAEVARGASVWRDGAVVLVLDGVPDAGRLIAGLRTAGISRVDVLVAGRGNRAIADVVADLRSRIHVRVVVAPSGHRIRDARGLDGTVRLSVGGLRVRLREQAGTVRADVTS